MVNGEVAIASQTLGVSEVTTRLNGVLQSGSWYAKSEDP